MCISEAAGAFELGDDRTVRVLVDDVEPAQLDDVRRAVRYCPTGALSLTGTDPTASEETDRGAQP